MDPCENPLYRIPDWEFLDAGGHHSRLASTSGKCRTNSSRYRVPNFVPLTATEGQWHAARNWETLRETLFEKGKHALKAQDHSSL